MDYCSQQQQQQQPQISVNYLDESIKALTQLATGGSPLKSEQQTSLGVVKLRKNSERTLQTPEAAKSHTYRISMANLEETQESELDVILGELSLLEAQINCGDAAFLPGAAAHNNGAVNVASINGSAPNTRTHSRTNSTLSGATTVSISAASDAPSSSSSGLSENGLSSSSSGSSNGGVGCSREPRTESPDNDSAFSDTVSLLSSESSVSSSASHHHKQLQQQQQLRMHYMQQQLIAAPLNSSKAAKIKLALTKLEQSSVRRLFVKAFTSDGASKSLLVDERMTCAHVTRLLADKNHVQMQPHWALVENLGDLQMERLFEDHELLVDNLMTWNSDAGNKVLFQQRPDKVSLFLKPELYLPGPQMAPGSQHDEHTRAMLLEEFFETNSQLQLDGPLYMKSDAKKGWKRHHFVLRSSGLYYFPKEKTKNIRDLACLTLFSGNNVYRGLGWKKKWKSPTDYTFGFKSEGDSSLGKNCRSLKMLCAEDLETLEKWITAIRISKYGKQLWEQHKALMEDLSMSDGSSNCSFGVSMRSESISSISSAVPSHCGSVSSAISSLSNSSSGRISRASSSSSSGCLSDDNNGFDSEFTTGTIKRKPSMKPNLPLTTMTRQLKEVGEITICEDGERADGAASPERSGTLTRRHSRRKSQESNGSGTLKRRQPMGIITKRGSAESMNNATGGFSSASSSNSTPTPTPSICARSLIAQQAEPIQTNCMSSSTLSLDSLPPPPPPAALNEEHEVYGSQLSLASLPPPPPPEDVMVPYIPASMLMNSCGNTPPAIPAKPMKTAVKPAPPYKAPPEYIGQQQQQQQLPPPAAPPQKKVSFADSPVLLRRKMGSPEPTPPMQQFYPLPPARSDITRLSTASSNNSNSTADFGSPKRLQESTSNPPRDFLKDLQRVMRKKWQVAQKCRLEPATTPHEVLGFRYFGDDLPHNHNQSTHYYRETANVSNWVQEHYGAGAPQPLPPNDFALYENLGNNGVGQSMPDGHLIMEPQFPVGLSSTQQQQAAAAAAAMAAARKKRPPPPPPKRSDSTHLTTTHRV